MPKLSQFDSRAQNLAVALLRSGKTHDEVRRRLPKVAGRAEPTNSTLNRWRVAHLGGNQRVIRGRGVKANKELEERILRDMRRGLELRSVKEITYSLNQGSISTVSMSTVYKVLKASSKIACKTRILQHVLKTHERRARVKFGKRYQNFEWDNTVFTDEKRWRAVRPTNRKAFYLTARGRPTKPSIWKKSKVRLDAMMFLRGDGDCQLFILDRRLHGVDYIQYIRNHVERGSTLYQDNGSSHTTPECRQGFRDLGLEVLAAPTYSADLNPVENAWARLADYVYEKDKVYYDVDKLLAAVEKGWRRMLAEEGRTEFFWKLVKSMPKRMKEVIRRRGLKTKY